MTLIYSILLKLHFSLLLKVLRDVLYTNGLWGKSTTYIDNFNAQTIFAVPTFQRTRGWVGCPNHQENPKGPKDLRLVYDQNHY